MKNASPRSACRVFVLALSALLIGGVAWARPSAPAAVGGLLDLRSWNFDRDGPVSLAGEWDFFPGELLSGSAAQMRPRLGERKVPDRWDSGFLAGTYRLTILLPPSSPVLGVRYSTVSTAFELEANGLVVAAAGRPGTEPRAAVPAYKPGVAPLEGAKDRVVLVVRVSNHEYRVGGMWRAFVLGDRAAMERDRWLRLASSLCLAAALAALALIFTLFVRIEEAGKGFALFSAFALAAALRTVVTGEYAIVDIFPRISFDAVIRFEYLSFYSLFPLALVFLRFLFPEELGKRPFLAVLGVCALFFPFLFAPLRVLTWTVVPYYAVAGLVIVATVATLARALARRRIGAIPLAVGGGCLVVAAINDLFFSAFVLNTQNLFPLGMLCFVASQAYVLAARYRGVQSRLRKALAEEEMLIREVHHRVKNSFQIVSSIVSLRSYRVVDPSMVAAYASIRDRIRAVSLVHEKLYSLESGDTVDIAGYARDLIGLLEESFGAGGSDVAVEADSFFAPPDLCIDLGLVLTELVSNAYKFAGGPDGSISVMVKIKVEGGFLSLSVGDAGPGFPEGFDATTVRTLGFLFVSSVAKKRDASLSIAAGPGALVELRFPLPLAESPSKDSRGQK
jgi:two-component sensor histidine kinase